MFFLSFVSMRVACKSNCSIASSWLLLTYPSISAISN